MTSYSDNNYRRERLRSGWLDLHRDEAGVWRLSWTPDPGHADFPGRTYSPGDGDLPTGYPGATDPDALIEWGKRQFGDR
jgi:hypothetical protein